MSGSATNANIFGDLFGSATPEQLAAQERETALGAARAAQIQDRQAAWDARPHAQVLP